MKRGLEKVLGAFNLAINLKTSFRFLFWEVCMCLALCVCQTARSTVRCCVYTSFLWSQVCFAWLLKLLKCGVFEERKIFFKKALVSSMANLCSSWNGSCVRNRQSLLETKVPSSRFVGETLGMQFRTNYLHMERTDLPGSFSSGLVTPIFAIHPHNLGGLK